MTYSYHTGKVKFLTQAGGVPVDYCTGSD